MSAVYSIISLQFSCSFGSFRCFSFSVQVLNEFRPVRVASVHINWRPWALSHTCSIILGSLYPPKIGANICYFLLLNSQIRCKNSWCNLIFKIHGHFLLFLPRISATWGHKKTNVFKTETGIQTYLSRPSKRNWKFCSTLSKLLFWMLSELLVKTSF